MEPVTIVSGLPRSGTSLMMQMLVAGGMPALTDSLRAPDDDNPRGYFELEAVKQTARDSAWLQDAPGKAVKVIHLLLRDLPGAYSYQVLFMRRAIDEVLRSQRVMIRRSGRVAPASDEMLAETFTRQVSQIRSWLDVQPNFRTLDVEYHRCLSEPSAAAAEINAFLGGVLNERAMIAAVDPQLHRQR